MNQGSTRCPEWKTAGHRGRRGASAFLSKASPPPTVSLIRKLHRRIGPVGEWAGRIAVNLLNARVGPDIPGDTLAGDAPALFASGATRAQAYPMHSCATKLLSRR